MRMPTGHDQRTADDAGPPLALPGVHAGTHLRAGAHLVALCSSQAERDALLYPYLRYGLDRDQSCMTCLSSAASQAVLARLSREVDVDGKRSSGQLAVCRAPDRVGATQSASEAASALWHRMVAHWPREMFGLARFLVEASSWLPDRNEHSELLRFESRLTALAVGQPVAFLFVYDVSDLDGGLVVELARAHPMLWACGVAVANPYCGAA